MSSKIINKNGKIIFLHIDCEYELRSHPYESCLYICKDDKIIKVLHNAFDVYELPSIFDAGETVRAINGLDFDEEGMKLTGKLKDKVESAETMEEKKDIIAEARYIRVRA